MLVELRLGGLGGEPVEVGEQVDEARLLAARPGLPLVRTLTHEVVHKRLGVHPLLDVQRRGVHHQVRRVLLILAAPDELRVKVAVASFVCYLDGAALLIPEQRLVLRARDVTPRGVVVSNRFHGLGLGDSEFPGHSVCFSYWPHRGTHTGWTASMHSAIMSPISSLSGVSFGGRPAISLCEGSARY